MQAGFPKRYFAIAYGWSWVFWALPLAIARGWVMSPWLVAMKIPLLMLGAFGPFVGAFGLSFRDGGKAAAGEVFKRVFRWRIPPVTLLLTLILIPALAALAVWIRSRQGGPALVSNLGWKQFFPLLVLMFFLGGSFQEEFGWAYAIDRMQPTWGWLKSSLLLGLLWACWHLPLFYMPGQAQSLMPFWTFVLMTVALRVMMVWTYNGARQSLLVTLLFHTSLNTTLNLFTLLNPNASPTKQVTWMYFVMLVVGAGVVVAFVGSQSESLGSSVGKGGSVFSEEIADSNDRIDLFLRQP